MTVSAGQILGRLGIAILLLTLVCTEVAGGETRRKTLHGHVPLVVKPLKAAGSLPGTNQLHLSLGLPLHHAQELHGLLNRLYDPQSGDFHKYLTTKEFTTRFGPTEEEYHQVIQFAEAHGLRVSTRHENRIVLDVVGEAIDIEKAFEITLRTYRHPKENRDFYAPDVNPSVSVNLPLQTIEGLSDYGRPKALTRKVSAPSPRPQGGTGPSGLYAGNDFRNAYVPGSTLDGAGQTVGLVQFSSYFPSDITNYQTTIGRTTFVPLRNVVVGHPAPDTTDNAEVALDIELVIAMAPGLSQVIVYETRSSASSLLSRIATDNLAKQISCSWTWSGTPSATIDNILLQMAAQGQSFFQASGDSDAYSGTQPLDSPSTVSSPVDSTNLTCVGGTTLTMSGGAAAWYAERVWNYNTYGAPNMGSGGGISSFYRIPYWQTNVSMAANSGSTSYRNIPDVAMAADGIYVAYNNGSSGGFAGTSCAAPLWAGFCALVNQQSMNRSGTTVGFLNPALYAIAAEANYTSCFHDVTSGNNIGTNTPGLFSAVAGYDLCTGLGTPNGTNLINALAPLGSVELLTQPSSQSVTNGSQVTLQATASGQSPLGYTWLFNGNALTDGGRISGAASNILTLSPVVTNDAGSYQLVVANSYGSVTSSVASLTVGFAPVFVLQPVNLTVLSGKSAAFSSSVTGTLPLNYQWRQNGTNLTDNSNVSGSTGNTLTLNSAATNSAGAFSVVVTNSFGAVTSAVATLAVALPPTLVGPLATPNVECGGLTSFTAVASGTGPLQYQWSLDGAELPGATSSTLTLSEIHPPDHLVSLVVANAYASVTNSTVVSVQDSIPPSIILNGSNPITLELGSFFDDPGATANDVCAGSLTVAGIGAVDTNSVGIYIRNYVASDPSGNSATVTRNIIVQDTTPPQVEWSFTNLLLVASAQCTVPIPDLTGTNYIVASDSSGSIAIYQSPTNGTLLWPGINNVVLSVHDASGNSTSITNTILVEDHTIPSLSLNGGNPLTVELGSIFSDPGANLSGGCNSSVTLTTNAAVDTSVLGTYFVVYSAWRDTAIIASTSRTVKVSDTLAPAIQWGFTNLVIPSEEDCTGTMPDVTVSNLLVVTDLSPPISLAQNPPQGSRLSLGTNSLVLSATDLAGNIAYATNAIVVQDQSLPRILSQPANFTTLSGNTASFSVEARACTPVKYQWFFNDSVLLPNQTNNALVLDTVKAADTGRYSVLVQSDLGTVTSAAATLQVNPLPTTVTLTSSQNPSGNGQSANFIAQVSPTDATGTVTFVTNGTSFEVQLLDTQSCARANLANLPRGTNQIVAIYSGNADALPCTNSWLQIVTNHPPNSIPVQYTRNAGSGFRIQISDLATNSTDEDGDALTLVFVGTSSNGVVLANDNGWLCYTNSQNVEDQFICQFADGWGGTNFQLVTIAVSTTSPEPAAAPLVSAVACSPNGTLKLTLQGSPGSHYVLESATNLLGGLGWSPLATNSPGTNTSWEFIDPQASQFNQRFYRLKWVP